MRAIKTVISVFLCLVLDSFRANSVPFYAAIASILCMQSNMDKSFVEAKKRIVATFVGGVFGILFLFIEKNFSVIDTRFLREFLVSFMLLPIIYLSVFLKQQKGTYITCVVFLSIVITHRLDVNPFAFGLNRMIDTIVGIAVSLIVNSFDFKFFKFLK